MATYVWKCPECVGRETTHEQDVPPVHQHAERTVLLRDYRAELVGVSIGPLKLEREQGGSTVIRDKFLPTAADYAGPNDPDGSKGIREWNDTHDPKNGNKRPMRPEGPRKMW